MRVTIDVTQDDIDNGIPGECCDCPVYLAARRALPDLEYVAAYVGTLALARLVADVAAEIPLPQPALDFIAAFDTRQPVSPFSFDLEIPDDLLAGAA